MAKVVLFGLSETTELIHFYLCHDSDHQVVAFTVDEKYLTQKSFCGLPVLPFEEIEKTHPPENYHMGVFLGFRDVNRLRANKYAEAKSKGYTMITYISSKAITWPGAVIGENCYVFEQTLIAPFATLGNNVVALAGCLIGHHSIISDHCFLSARTVVLGCSKVGNYCVLGANSTVKDLVTVADSCVVGVGAEITKNTQPSQVYVSDPPRLLEKSSEQLSRWITWSAGHGKRRNGS
ncbi:MAG TPA: UDP-glucose 4-epimerase [Nitrospiraceae bacterium]|jgi:sugar O-acyltransferase (sialic acid O-acetyltransferase NeuD family)|nr:UDP-glucose 4-epimerase [Nitrospiraceae bacterium]